MPEQNLKCCTSQAGQPGEEMVGATGFAPPSSHAPDTSNASPATTPQPADAKVEIPAVLWWRIVRALHTVADLHDRVGFGGVSVLDDITLGCHSLLADIDNAGVRQ